MNPNAASWEPSEVNASGPFPVEEQSSWAPSVTPYWDPSNALYNSSGALGGAAHAGGDPAGWRPRGRRNPGGGWGGGRRGERRDRNRDSRDGRGPRSKGGYKGEKNGYAGSNNDYYNSEDWRFEGLWIDSLGNEVDVSPPSRGIANPLIAKLSPPSATSRPKTLSLRWDRDSFEWLCGNARLDTTASTAERLIWADNKGRRSIWERKSEPGADSQKAEESKEEDQSEAKSFPWLLIPTTETDEGVQIHQNSQAASHCPDEVAEDGARIACLMDIRQMLGAKNDRQEALSYLLMDHDIQRAADEDFLVPKHDSPLWSRLESLEGVDLDSIRQRVKAFSVGDKIPITPVGEGALLSIRIGRHCFTPAGNDVEALRKRWTGPPDDQKWAIASAHVLALYHVLENPLATSNRRICLHHGWDPAKRKKAGIQFELFASPFNTLVQNGRYASKWPHAEIAFGSAGSYPEVIDKFPEGAVVGVNPPFSDDYLAHVMSENLDRLMRRFELHLFVPVRDAPWRCSLSRLSAGATFMQQFWDHTAGEVRLPMQPVVYWHGGPLES